ncbi:hypothetical protein EGR_10294 [Echinococcus granulosus]|uniref:Uncharacterized protein n=1 Tax=Echinococcus granulosus TaxID=6210 RepID=W6U2R8_ECHGR|nr:hypothetical protein EGR_10294 [Echinococcus granulosus]EUB54851.1 hypothetical protein EGR_10294 [Echinococcus granulosus]
MNWIRHLALTSTKRAECSNLKKGKNKYKLEGYFLPIRKILSRLQSTNDDVKVQMSTFKVMWENPESPEKVERRQICLCVLAHVKTSPSITVVSEIFTFQFYQRFSPNYKTLEDAHLSNTLTPKACNTIVVTLIPIPRAFSNCLLTTAHVNMRLDEVSVNGIAPADADADGNANANANTSKMSLISRMDSAINTTTAVSDMEHKRTKVFAQCNLHNTCFILNKDFIFCDSVDFCKIPLKCF